MKLTLVSDAWAPQVNGVVRTLQRTIAELEGRGHEVQTITPDLFRTFPCPSYPEIRLAIGAGERMAKMISDFAPDNVHVATEGPLGWVARRWCLRQGQAFTTSFHTRFPDYVEARTGIPANWIWPVMQRFHKPALHVMTATPRLAEELHGRGIRQTHLWSRGVDLAHFSPDAATHPAYANLPRPIQLYVGRVAVEKNIEAFLACMTPGSKVVVGDGPTLARLRAAHPDVTFLGMLQGADLASAYAGADVFVFPSLTDTFGLVMIEALACGVPVAGFPVPGPLDVVGADGMGGFVRQARPIGALDHDLDTAISRALTADRADCADYATQFSWERCTDAFLAVQQAAARR